MDSKERLKGKTILIVDDEPDILGTVADLLPMCQVVKAGDFETAKTYLEARFFDIAILDIMGVDGYQLLEIATQRKITAVMLTAHALSPENTVKSFKQGAASYVPKEKLWDIATYLNDILEAKDKGQSVFWRWMDRIGDYYTEKFGTHWQQAEKEFWDRFGQHKE